MSPRWNWDFPIPPLSTASVPLPPEPKGGHTRLRARGWGSPNSDDWRKSLALCQLSGRIRPKWSRFPQPTFSSPELPILRVGAVSVPKLLVLPPLLLPPSVRWLDAVLLVGLLPACQSAKRL
jgi:hypothetical protein